eukprot:2396310-Rhodomonas_salina.1
MDVGALCRRSHLRSLGRRVPIFHTVARLARHALGPLCACCYRRGHGRPVPTGLAQSPIIAGSVAVPFSACCFCFCLRFCFCLGALACTQTRPPCGVT